MCRFLEEILCYMIGLFFVQAPNGSLIGSFIIPSGQGGIPEGTCSYSGIHLLKRPPDHQERPCTWVGALKGVLRGYRRCGPRGGEKLNCPYS